MGPPHEDLGSPPEPRASRPADQSPEVVVLDAGATPDAWAMGTHETDGVVAPEEPLEVVALEAAETLDAVARQAAETLGVATFDLEEALEGVALNS